VIATTLYMILLAILELSGLIMFMGGVFKQEWGYVMVGIAVFGTFRWVFNKNAERIEREYRSRFDE
jgi:hypothetical protein